MKALCIIPARGGSKRIPDKNIRDFLGRPIINYSIEAALQCKLFEEVMVSTDSEIIERIAKSSGAQVPFRRSAATATDHATTMEVIHEVYRNYKQHGRSFDYVCCVYPANPFITPERLQESFAVLHSRNADCLLSAVKYSHPVERGFRLANDKVQLLSPEHVNTRSQDLQPVYHDAAQFYWFKSSFIETGRSIWQGNPEAIIVPEEESQDIDTLSDWLLAELKYKLVHGIL